MHFKSCQQCLEAIALSCSAPRDDSSDSVEDVLERDGREAARAHEKQWPLFLPCFNSLRLYFLHLQGTCVYEVDTHTHTRAMG